MHWEKSWDVGLEVSLRKRVGLLQVYTLILPPGRRPRHAQGPQDHSECTLILPSLLFIIHIALFTIFSLIRFFFFFIVVSFNQIESEADESRASLARAWTVPGI